MQDRESHPEDMRDIPLHLARLLGLLAVACTLISCGPSTNIESEPSAQSGQKVPTVDELTEYIEKRIYGGTISELLYYLGLVQPGGVPVFEYGHDTNPDRGGKPTMGFWCIYSIDSVKPRTQAGD